MKVLYSWLKDFVPLEISPQETAAVLAKLGFEIADIRILGGQLSGVVTAEVRETSKHPNADRLSLCRVWDGTSEFSVVCGAPNVAPGLKVAFARAGATLPNGDVLRAAKIRGVESQGMICSASELGLEEKSAGILELAPNTAPGQDVRKVLELDDALIEIELTPNRRDALGILGVARELAAGLNLPLKNLEPRSRELDLASSPVTVVNEAQDLCPRYTARYIRDVKIGPSPEWMARRLSRCGYRPINNVVDITNYVMHELGQPMHAFDAASLEGRQLRVRRAQKGEKIHTLEDKTAQLEAGVLVIADAKHPVAVAGVIGGEASSIGPETTEIVLESAAFSATHIRRTSKLLGIRTESSYRFERGSDWDMVMLASRRASQLIQDLAGGLACKPHETSSLSLQPISIKLRTERLKTFLGLDIKESVAADLLRRLGCVISMGTGQLLVTVPSWRLDLSMDADLLEEIARLYGYDQIPVRNPSIRLTSVPDDALRAFERRCAAILAGLGLSEACNTSFLSLKQVAPWTPGLGAPRDSKPIAVANPLSLEQAVLRSNLLPGLLQSALLNFNRQNRSVRLFEVGRVFSEEHEGRREMRRLGILLGGDNGLPHWRVKERKSDYFDLTGFLDSFLKSLSIHNFRFSAHRENAFHPKRSVAVLSGTGVLGWAGEIHPDLAKELDTREPLLAAELDVQALFKIMPGQASYIAPSPYPPVRRDLSIVAPESATYEQISKTLRGAGGKELESIALVDLYKGEKIGAGYRSLTMALAFRDKAKTLSDADVEKLMQKIIHDLETKCEATLRK